MLYTAVYCCWYNSTNTSWTLHVKSHPFHKAPLFCCNLVGVPQILQSFLQNLCCVGLKCSHDISRLIYHNRSIRRPRGMQHYATTYNNKILCMAHHGSRWLAEQKLSEWPTSTGLRRLMGIKNGSCQSVATITKQDGSGESQICNILPYHILPKLVQCTTIYRNTDDQKIGTGWHRKG